MNAFINIQIRVLTQQARQQLAQINTQLGALNRAFGVAGAGGSKFGGILSRMGLEAFGSRVQWIGRQLDYNFTLPILIAGTAASKWALDNEAAMTRVVKVYGDGTRSAQIYKNEIKALGGAFKELSNHFGVNQAAVINIAADWAAAGAVGLQLARSVRITLETMILGEMDAVEATKALISIQAQYGQSTDQLIETIGVLNMVENQTGVTLAGLVDGFGRAAGVARSAGVDVRHLAAMIAAISPAAGSATQAGNALKTIFSRLLSPTAETAEVLGLIGINMRDIGWQGATMVDRLTLLATKFETLSDSQKNYISSIIASRWQVNRFDILMRELVSTTGYYQKALDATADKQRVFNQMQYELNTVLSSNPRKLQIIWTTLQNAAADVIGPMLPLIIYLAQSIQHLVSWFSNLNPGVQKLALLFLALLAAVGPIVRLFGALGILVGVAGKGLMILLAPLGLIASAFKKTGFITLAFVNTLKFVGSVLGAVLLPLWRGFFTTMVAATRIGWAAVLGVWRAGSQLLVALVMLTSRFVAIGWGHLAVFLGTMTGTIWTRGILPVWRAGQAALLAMMLPWAAVVGRLWRTLMQGILLMTTRAFWVGILGTVTNFFRAGLLPLLFRAGTAVIAAMTGPWGLAIAAVVTLLVVFWKQIKQAFHGVINSVAAGWNALPAVIQNALMSVVRTVAAAVRVVREWLSYLNPFARHSPSLVDNVTAGIAVIIRQYQQLRNIGGILRNAGISIEQFGKSFHNVVQLADQMNWSEQAQQVAEFAPELTGDFNNLLNMLKALQGEMGDLADQYPYEQAKAFSDAIFENDMQIKALRLQMMQMEDAVGPLDKLQGKIESINGLMELTAGTRESLRDAGAGGEILSQYDDQLSALQDQKSVIEQQLKPIQDLADQIEQLQRIGEELNLEQSLALDPITRQMDELADAIRQVEDALAAVASVASDAKQAMDGASGGGGGAGGGGGLPPGADIFDPGGMGQIGGEGGLGDQSALIDEFTANLAKETANMFGLFNFLDPIKAGWNKAMDWMGKNIGPAWSAFWSTLKSDVGSAFGGVGDWFEGLDLSGFTNTISDFFSKVKPVWDFIVRLFAPALKELWETLANKWKEAVDKIAPKLQEFRNLVEPLGDAFSKLWGIAKPILALLGGAILFIADFVLNTFVNVLGSTLDFVISVIGGIIDVFRGIIEFLTGIFTGNWRLAWKGVVDILKGIWDTLVAIFRYPFDVVWGIIKGFGETVKDFFSALWGGVKTKVGEAADWIKQKFDGIVSAIGGMGGRIASAAIGMWDGIKNAFKSAMNWIIRKWNNFGFHLDVPGPWDIDVSTPNIPEWASGAKVSQATLAVIGEGRRGYPEYVIPTDPAYTQETMGLLRSLFKDIGYNKMLQYVFGGSTLPQYATGGILGYAGGGVLGGRTSRGTGVVVRHHTVKQFNFYGDLEFPNVKDGNDAEEFIRNLEALADDV